jgi:subtilisin family serine protease
VAAYARILRVLSILLCATSLAGILAVSARAADPPGHRMLKPEPVRRHVVVGYETQEALAAALARYPAKIVRRLPRLRAVELDPDLQRDHFATALRQLPGIAYVDGLETRRFHAEPALVAVFRPGLPYEWQYVATRANEVPEAVLHAAAGFKIAVVDTGADVTHPDLAAKSPETWDVVRRRAPVADLEGHGTFVAALAAGSVSNGEGIAGFGGDARLLVVKASGNEGMFTDVDEAAAIVYAVDHGAKVINLSLGGEGTSELEQQAVRYASSRDVLLVAAVGNEYDAGNPIEYPAALLQPPGSKGQGGVGLVVGATTMAGRRAHFSNTGTHLSLAAPGENVFGAVAAGSKAAHWPRYALPGSAKGLYGWSSGTSFSTPQVTGAAALVWAANPQLSAAQVAGLLKATASGRGAWNPSLGYGVLNVAGAVAAATGQSVAERVQAGSWLRVTLARTGSGRGRASRRPRLRAVRLSAWLRTSTPTVSPAHRVVSLEVLGRRGWRRLARTTTRSGGNVRWTVGLRRGSYRLRVTYGGRWDLRQTARVLRVRVR